MADEQSGEDNTFLVDLDGSIADFDKRMKERLELLRGPGEPDYGDNYDDVPSYIKARRDLIKRQPGFWRGLDRLDRGFEVVDYARSIGFRLNTLTKCPKKNPMAWTEKVEWCIENIPDALITLTEDKTNVYGKVLLDDYPPYFLPWLKVRPRGLVIAVAQPWNLGVTHPNLIRYDGTNLDQVKEALDRAYRRVGRQSL
jgi:5'-nucleotidase